ncbi:hypothetical protein AVEN_269190-1 [Araneus ventricosus]|uniref:DUF4219 domain-containing protein n=1 Tax=Araneus ventricosus TaxID=182803 RepID=A0A4Y2I236_ARAVE|nr:hypothetical protein AVEN_269190-1 [Araneus ventricosus]
MVDSMVNNSLTFSKLNDDNWRHWKFNMEMLLCYEGLFGFIEGTEEEPTGDKVSEKDKIEFRRHKQKAISTIVMGINEEQQNLILV